MSPATACKPQPAAEGQVICMDVKEVVILVIGVATILVALVGLMIKLVELGRK